jgi:hypothetical protein
VENTELPVLTLSTEPGSSQQENLQQIREFMNKLRESSASK